MASIKFIEYYEKYLIGDIDAMIEKADEKSDGNQMAVPITFSIFSCLDVFGFLMRYKKDSNNSKEELNKTSLNIAYAMLKWNGFGFPQFDIQNSPNKSNNKLLFAFIEIYRNGIMHTFFPKDFSISNKKENEAYELFYKANDILVFNVRKFYIFFKDFIKVFKKELSSNEDFNNDIEENINLVFKKDNSFDYFIKEISKIERFSLSFYPTITVETSKAPDVTNL